MTCDELIQAVYRKAMGELDPTVTHLTEDGKTILAIINEMVGYYYNITDEDGQPVNWARNFDPEYIIGEIDEDSIYPIDYDEVKGIAINFRNRIRLIDPEGILDTVEYAIVPIDELWSATHDFDKVCSIAQDGIIFKTGFAVGDVEYGMSIQADVFLCGRPLVGSEKNVEDHTLVHNLLWLQYASAAEYVRTDIVRGGQYPNLLAQSNDVLSKMIKENNRRQTALTYSWD